MTDLSNNCVLSQISKKVSSSNNHVMLKCFYNRIIEIKKVSLGNRWEQWQWIWNIASFRGNNYGRVILDKTKQTK